MARSTRRLVGMVAVSGVIAALALTGCSSSSSSSEAAAA
ncbi:MAG: phosphate/phosphite/phosphonate ABC transporter substrate-binding protein, partial [Actinobacteria bacterium]|nr:phosphate/phosphite/phosphonate ABC transporter substrate-binding protein [Actinomycetota bacterium]